MSDQHTKQDTTSTKRAVVALAGNPNTGKTSLFNMLTGLSQHVGNYPGVTVDKITGVASLDGRTLDVVDLPGTYSMSAYSLEEIVTRDFLVKERPDVVVDVLDSTNLERNLYLLLQYQELGFPIVGALNMADEAERRGVHINIPLLSQLLGIPLVSTVGNRGSGKAELLRAVFSVLDSHFDTNARHLNYGPELEDRHEELMDVLRTDIQFSDRYSLHWIAIKLLEEDSDAIARVRAEHSCAEAVLAKAESAVEWVTSHFGRDAEVVVGEQRYAYIRGALREAVHTDPKRDSKPDPTDVIDAVVLNRYLGVPIFLAVMLAIYALTFLAGNPLAAIIESAVGQLGSHVGSLLPEGVLREAVVDGIVSGVGAVLAFLPIVVLLFLGLSFLEDVGYMARAAFVMDKFLHLFGLHGRSFISLMVSTGCAVPGVMSARILVNTKDRILTVLIAPLMMCGAKTPVVAMLCAAFFDRHAPLVFVTIWILSWLLAFAIGLLFRKTLYRGEDSPFVMELPPYRLPTLGGIASHVWHRSWSYVKKAGTLILAASILIWVMLSFPRYSEDQTAEQVTTIEQTTSEQPAKLDQLPPTQLRPTSGTTLEPERDATIASLRAGEAMRRAERSFAGRIGKFVEPLMLCAGIDWRSSVALLSGIAAKETIISTMGIVFGLGTHGAIEYADDADHDSVAINGDTSKPQVSLKNSLRHDKAMSASSGLALIVFVVVYIPCIATLSAVRKELGSIKWPAFMVAYTFALAWILAVATFQIAKQF